MAQPHVRADHLLLPFALLLVVVSAIIAWQSSRGVEASASEVARLNRLLYANEALLSGLKDLETGQRGYLLTGDRKYLGPLERANRDLPNLIESLSREITHPQQRARLRQIVILVAQKQAELQSTIRARDDLGPDAALAIVRTDEGLESMDAIRALCGAINQQARASLAANAGSLADRQRRGSNLLAGINVLLFLLLVSASLTIHRGVVRRDELIEQLDSARQHLHTTLSSIGDGVIATDTAGTVIFANSVAARIMGLSEKDALGKSIEAALPLLIESTHKAIEHPVRFALREKRAASMKGHIIYVRPDGTEVPVDDSAAPILSSDGNRLNGAVMVLRDITQRRMAELSIRKWEHVFQHAGFGMAVLSPDEDDPRLQQVNPAFALMHGYSQSELENASLSLVVSPCAWAGEMNGFREAGLNGHVIIQTVHRRRDGAEFPTLADVTVVKDPAGQALYGTAYYSDITERVTAEEELRRNEAHFRTLADSLPQLVWTTHPDGAADYFNNRWKDETDFDITGMEGKGWHDFLHPDDRDQCLREWEEALSQEKVFQTECRLGKPGRHRWYICRAIPVRGADGKVVRWFGSCTDIHESKQVANALRVSKDQLQRTNFDLEQFAYAASHDLQEPLRMVVIYAQLLREEFGAILQGKGETYLTFAVEGALRMESLIKGLLAYSRASGPAEISPGGTAVSDAVETALANLKIQIEQSGARIEVGPLPRLNVPELHMTLVFQNLIGNAIKYRRPDHAPFVSISACRQSDEWLFSVRDNGIGIDSQYHDQIFLVFRRLHGAELPGTGIGLALCQRLIERYGGRIRVESNGDRDSDDDSDRGSTFRFTLPAR